MVFAFKALIQNILSKCYEIYLSKCVNNNNIELFSASKFSIIRENKKIWPKYYLVRKVIKFSSWNHTDDRHRVKNNFLELKVCKKYIFAKNSTFGFWNIRKKKLLRTCSKLKNNKSHLLLFIFLYYFILNRILCLRTYLLGLIISTFLYFVTLRVILTAVFL